MAIHTNDVVSLQQPSYHFKFARFENRRLFNNTFYNKYVCSKGCSPKELYKDSASGQ